MTSGAHSTPSVQGLRKAAQSGFYQGSFRPEEREALAAAAAGGLLDEIVMLRVVARRLLALAEGLQNAEEMIDVLGALGLASTRLARLLKDQKDLGKQSDVLGAAISQALNEVVAELGLRRAS